MKSPKILSTVQTPNYCAPWISNNSTLFNPVLTQKLVVPKIKSRNSLNQIGGSCRIMITEPSSRSITPGKSSSRVVQSMVDSMPVYQKNRA